MPFRENKGLQQDNIFFAHSVNVIGGAEKVTLSIIQGLPESYNCVLLAPEGKDLGSVSVSAGAIFEPISCLQPEFRKPFRSLKDQYRNYKLFKRYQPRIVHVGDLLAFRNLQPVCHLLKIPMICHVHFPYQQSFMDWCFKKRYAPAQFIFCSQELKDNLSETLRKLCPQSEFDVIHNGVDADYFNVDRRPNNSKLRIGIIANLQYRKGHDDFLNMAKILTNEGVDAIYDIIGGDILQEPREQKLRDLTSSLGLSDRVVFHGQTSDIRSALSSLDIFVCASHEEAFPISILEAMASGKVIVSTNVNGIPEAITDGVEGLLTPPFRPDLLAKSVLKVLGSRSLKWELEYNSRKKLVNNFSLKIFNKNIERLYKRILS